MRTFISTVIGLLVLCNNCNAQSIDILNVSKISATAGNFSGLGPNLRSLGRAISTIGDLDKDGIADFAVTGYDQVNLEGIVFILFMNANQTVKSHSIIGRNRGGLNGTFGVMQTFGNSLVSLGDIDGDNNNDLLVGNFDGAVNGRGEVFVLLMNSNGTVKSYQILGPNQLSLTNNASFGLSTSLLGDINNDGKIEVAITSQGSEWAIHILSLNSDGTLFSGKRINQTLGGFSGNPNGALSRASVVGDINNDAIIDLVASNSNLNELWVLFLDTAGTVKSHQRIAQGVGGYTDTITSYELFGIAMSPLVDMDGDGVPDIAISSDRDSVDSIKSGRVRILFMNTNGTVKSIKRIDYTTPGFGFSVGEDAFGRGLIGGFDINGDFKNDLIIGAPSTDDGGDNKGAIYLLSMDGAVHPAPPQAQWRVNATSGNQNTVFTFTQYSTGFPSQYQWSFTPNTVQYQNGTTDTSANPVVKFTQSATYSVQLKVTNPFSEDSLLRNNYITIQTVGLKNATTNSNAVTLYPNPATSHVQVQSPVSMQAIYVYDITGKQLLHHTPHTTADELNLSELNTGMYTIHVVTETGTTCVKLMKNNE